MSHLAMQCIVQRISANINDVNKISTVTVKVFQPWYWCRPTVQWGIPDCIFMFTNYWN